MYKVKSELCWFATIIVVVLTIAHIPQWAMGGVPQTWTYELNDVKFFTSDPDILDGDLQVVRLARGVFGISGYFDVKKDIDDAFFIEGTLYRSSNGVDDYRKMPFDINNEKFSDAMSKYYKPLIMDTVQECTTDAPLFDEFQAPLTKRYIKVDKCQISTENMPSHMAEGLYKMSVMLHGGLEASIETYFEIEKKKLY